MPINPCGRAVDIGRRPYTTKARFFTDSNVETDIEWYVTPKDRGTVSIPSKFSSLDWSSHPWIAEGVGEVYNRPRLYNGKWKLQVKDSPPYCGSQIEVARGVNFDATRDVKYDGQTIPCCCRGTIVQLPFNFVNSAHPVPFGPWVEVSTVGFPHGGFTGFFVLDGGVPPASPVWCEVKLCIPFEPVLHPIFFDLATYPGSGLSWDQLVVMPFALPSVASLVPIPGNSVQLGVIVSPGIWPQIPSCGIFLKFRFGTGAPP